MSRRATWRALVRIALALVATLGGRVGAPSRASAAGPAFTCSNLAYFSAGGNSSTQLYSVDTSVVPFNLTAIGSAASISYNGIGYNVNDNYIYGLQAQKLVQIDSTGAATVLGTISGAPTSINASGAVLPNGTFVASGGTSLYFISISGLSVSSSVSTGYSFSDLAYNPGDGYLYGVSSQGGKDVTVQMTTAGAVNKTIAQTDTTLGVNAGAQWFDSSGHYFFGSTNGQFYQVNLSNGDITSLSTNTAYNSVDATSCSSATAPANNSTITVGPVGADATTGSYDGNVGATSNNDFTAASFGPTSGTPSNAGTTPGTPVGSTLGAVTPFVVANQFSFGGGAAAGTSISFQAVAPSSPSGWTVQICPAKPSPPGTGSCAAQASSTSAGYWSAVSAAGGTATGTFTVPANVTSASSVVFYVRYAPPSGTTAYARYDATVTGQAGSGNDNATHDELYAGFVPLTKSVTTQTAGSCAAVPASGGACPGSTLLYAIDYRNIMVGGSSESGVPSALLATGAGSLQIVENGNAAGSTWGASTAGLNDALVAGANGTSTYGDTTSGSTFTGNAVGSTSFADVVGGSSFSLVAPGVSGTSQGTLYFRVVVQ